MLTSFIVRVVGLCIARPWWMIALAFGLATGSTIYAVRHFAIKTDINDLISPDLPWAQRALQYMKDFPERYIVVVVDAPTPENADQATPRRGVALDPSPGGAPVRPVLGLVGVERKEVKLDDVTLPLTMAADTVERVLAG